MERIIKLWLIRHGKTPGNEEKRYVGRTDEGLSALGKKELLERHFPKMRLLFSSPMKRCLESCEILWPGMETMVISEFREIDFGRFEGKNYQELSGNKDYQAWIDSGGEMPFPGGEGREEFVQRSLSGFWKMFSRIADFDDGEASREGMKSGGATLKDVDESCVLAAAVVHGGTIMSVLSKLYGGDYYDYQIPNGAGYLVTIRMAGDDARILSAERV